MQLPVMASAGGTVNSSVTLRPSALCLTRAIRATVQEKDPPPKFTIDPAVLIALCKAYSSLGRIAAVVQDVFKQVAGIAPAGFNRLGKALQSTAVQVSLGEIPGHVQWQPSKPRKTIMCDGVGK